MKVGWVGLGKLGLPCALAMESKGHEIGGFDSSDRVLLSIRNRSVPYIESGMPELLKATGIKLFDSIAAVEQWADLVFVAVQTPHDARFDGTKPLNEERADFDYSFVRTALHHLERSEKPVVLVSTVLPGTLAGLTKPKHFIYNPFFIAMGTTVWDFLHPEFVLLGSDVPDSIRGIINDLYRSLVGSVEIFWTSIPTAELTKIAYNTFISMKVVFANHIGECAGIVGADAHNVIEVLRQARRRIISDAYLSPGMGDGGGCHPRDNIAMSWFARTHEESFDLAGTMMQARDAQTRQLAQLVLNLARDHNLPIVIMGRAYKPNCNLTNGSAALLLLHYLPHATAYDPLVAPGIPPPTHPAVYVLATPHDAFESFIYSPGSIVYDPWSLTLSKK